MTTAGLCLDLIGAILLGWGLIRESDRDIIGRTVPMTGTLASSQPAIRTAQRSRRLGQLGVGLLVIGFALQLIAHIS